MRTKATVVEHAGSLRQGAATVVGLLLVAGGFIAFRWIDEACSDSVARCNWAIPSIPFAIAAIFGCPFVMARLTSRSRWGARGALALPFLLIVMNSAQELIDYLLTRPPVIPPFPGVTAIVVGVGAAAAVTAPSVGLELRMKHLATAVALSGVPAILVAVLLRDDGPLTVLVALVGLGLGLASRTGGGHGSRSVGLRSGSRGGATVQADPGPGP